jgi:hypothetical protein
VVDCLKFFHAIAIKRNYLVVVIMGDLWFLMLTVLSLFLIREFVALDLSLKRLCAYAQNKPISSQNAPHAVYFLRK